MTPDPLRAVAERLARDVFNNWAISPGLRGDLHIALVLAGLTHAARPVDRTADDADLSDLPAPTVGEMDATKWAESFVAHIERCPSIATDKGAMVAWFASAIMAGWDGKERRIEQGARDRTAEREAARKAYARGWQDCLTPGIRQDAARDRYLAAEFDAGERVTLSNGSVVTLGDSLTPRGFFLVVREGLRRPDVAVEDWRYLAVTGEDFEKLKRLAEQRGAER